MFDFAWSEIALIGAVALLAIGPKDMPMAIKSIAGVVKKARRMAGEFQTHVDDLMKEADLSEVRSHLGELRSFNLRDQVTRAVDPDGALRDTFADQPAVPAAPAADPVEAFVGMRPSNVIRTPPQGMGMGPSPYHGAYNAPPPDHLRPALAEPPAFIPPEAVALERAVQAAPAFIPPPDVARGVDC